MTRSSLRPGPRSGLEIVEARHWRITAAAGGSVVMTGPSGSDTVVAKPGEVARVVVLRGAQAPGHRLAPAGFDEALAVLTDERALLVVPLHLLAHGNVQDAAELRRVSGAADFAQALGLSLEPASDADAALAASAQTLVTRGPERERLRGVSVRHLVLLVVAVVAALLSLVLADAVAAVAGLVGALAVLLLAVDQWRHRSSFLRLVTEGLPGHGRVAVPNRLPDDQPRGVRSARLEIGPDDVVHAVTGTETWVAGPRAGGVVACMVSDDVVRFLDRHEAELLVVGAQSWAAGGDVTALTAACESAGITIVRHRGRASRTAQPDLAVALASTDPTLGGTMSPTAVGDMVVAAPFATSLLALFLAVTHVSPVDELDAVRGAVVGLSIVALALSAGAQLRLRQWSRRQTRTEG